MPRNVGDLGKLIAAKFFKKLPKVQKIARSGHTATEPQPLRSFLYLWRHSVIDHLKISWERLLMRYESASYVSSPVMNSVDWNWSASTPL